MLHELFTRAWAWYSRRDRGQRFEIQLIFDEDEAASGVLGPHNKIFAYANQADLAETVERAREVAIARLARDATRTARTGAPDTSEADVRVHVIDRKTIGLQMSMHVFTLCGNKPRTSKTEVFTASPETLPLVISRFVEDAPRRLLQSIKPHIPDPSSTLELIDVETWAGPRSNDIMIRVYRRVNSEHRMWAITRSREVLCHDGEWRQFQAGTYRASTEIQIAGYLHGSLLDVCRAMLGTEFEELEREANLWSLGDEPDELIDRLQQGFGGDSV